MLAINDYSPSGGWDFATGSTSQSPARTSTTYFDVQDQFHSIRSHILHQIQAVWGHCHQIAATELLQLTKYTQHQHYVPHWDYFNVPGVEVSTDNDRIATVIIYLNDDFLGGTTSFPHLALQVHAKVGHMLYFCYPPGDRAHFTKHSGDQVLSGEKKIATMWIRPQ